MQLLEFPAALPIPQELPTQSAERRVLSPDGGLFEVRVGQTDRKGYEDYAFPPYSPTQAEALDYFWRVTLNKGGKWFSTTAGRHWPRPEGWIAATRRFVGPPAWEYIHTGKAEGGYWRVTGVFEVRGVGELPVSMTRPLFLLHFDGNLTDTSGHLFEADVIFIEGSNTFAYATDAPKFGTASGRFNGTNAHVRSQIFPDAEVQFSDFDFQIEGWLRPATPGVETAGPIIQTTSLGGGSITGPNPGDGQFELTLEDIGEFVLKYSTAIGNASPPVVTPILVPLDGVTWAHWAIACDATSLRLYVNGVLANEAPGVRPFAGAYVDQRFIIGAFYTGGVPPLETYTSRSNGDVDEIRAIKEVTYTGPTITVPTAPFSKRGV